MTMTHWLLVIFAIAAFARRKQILRGLASAARWDPVVWFATILWAVLFGGFAALTLWLVREYGWKGALGPLAFVIAYSAWCRIRTGKWPGEDTTIHLD